jgi:hypothetical protein
MKQDWCNIPVRISWHSGDYQIAMERWLEENVDQRDWDRETQYAHLTYFFARAKDATMFALRWS